MMKMITDDDVGGNFPLLIMIMLYIQMDKGKGTKNKGKDETYCSN